MQLPALLALLPLLPASRADPLTITPTLRHTCSRATKAGDTVNMHYRGTLEATGAKFDASYDRNQPLTFRVGAGQVIKGWDQGLLDMCPGDKRTLRIEPDFGYGSRAMGPIPANSVLGEFAAVRCGGRTGLTRMAVFETELVSIEGVAAEEKVVLDEGKKEDVKAEATKEEAQEPVPVENPQDEAEGEKKRDEL